MASTSQLTVDSIYVSKAVNALIARKDSISIRFSVQIHIERPRDSQGDCCWVNISGIPSKVQDAKTYIKCLCDPEDSGSVLYPGEMHGRLSEKSFVFHLEHEYKVIIEFKDGQYEDDPGQALIKGDTLSVALALSAIEDIIATHQPQNDLSAGASAPHSYSEQTSNKLNHSLKDISDKGGLNLENEEVAQYSDVMKKLVLSWASDSTGEQEVVDLEALHSDSEESTTPSVASTSTPKSTASRVKVEPLANLNDTSKRPVPARRYFDLTTPAKRVELSDSEDESLQYVKEVKPSSSKIKNGKGSQSSASYSSSSTSAYPNSTTYKSTSSKRSPTTQAEKDISTITLDDESSDITELEKVVSPPTPGLEKRLVEMAKSKGYDEIEIAMALSGCGVELNEGKFVSLLNAGKSERPSSSPSTTGKKAKPTPARRNAVMESINKRQIQPCSPTSKAVMPTEKRVKTVPSTSPAAPHTAPLSNYTQQQEVIELPKPINHQEQGDYRAQRNPGNSVAGPSNYQPLNFQSQHFQAPNFNQRNGQLPPANYGQFPGPSYNPPVPVGMSAPGMQMQGGGHYGPPMGQQAPDPYPFESKPPELPNKPLVPTRMLVLDGSNIAFAHGKRYHGHAKVFSSRGILLAINYLRKTYGATSENIKAIVPNFRRCDMTTREPHLLDEMATSQYLVFSPCKTMPGGKKIVPYDDRFILDLAVATNGVVLSNDKYADLIRDQNGKYTDVINNRVIMFMFVDDLFMIPTDPMGRYGPLLDQLLQLPGSRKVEAHPAKRTVSEPVSLQPQPTGNRFTPLSTTSLPMKERTHAETSALETQLLEVFPDKRQDITRLLMRHPHEKTVNVFVDKLV